MADFRYMVVDEFDHIVDEKANTFIAMRKVAWGENPDPAKAKLEIRKWHMQADGTETPSKGFAFLTEEGPNNLVHTMLNTGYGRTETVIRTIQDRDDFKEALNKVLGPESEFFDKTVVSSENLYVPGNGLFDYEE